MAVILDIAGKPMPHRKRSNRARAEDMRDLSKIVMVLLLIVLGFFLFAPDGSKADETRVAAAQKAQG